MRVLFWNINGISRKEAKYKLYELVKEFKPDIIGLAEPRVACSARFRRSLKINGFSSEIIHNSVDNNIVNLWILSSSSMMVPVVINNPRQAITVSVDGVHISFIHAGYLQVTRRQLWQQLDIG